MAICSKESQLSKERSRPLFSITRKRYLDSLAERGQLESTKVVDAVVMGVAAFEEHG